MLRMRGLVCAFGIAIALAPTASFAATNDVDAKFANAQAQMTLAQQRVADIQADADLAGQNERMIALLQSQNFRQQQLDTMANANAIDQISSALVNAARAQGEMNARNALAIAQIKAGAMVMQADSSLANAIAQDRTDEIANATARSTTLHQLADLITSDLAEQDMSNARRIAESRADAIHTPALAQVQNAQALAAADLLAADTALQAAEVRVSNAHAKGTAKADAILANAQSNLQNAAVVASKAQ